jgi:hypothetical protein
LLQQGGTGRGEGAKPFQRFTRCVETVETVKPLPPANTTPLKWGVNEKRHFLAEMPVKAAGPPPSPPQKFGGLRPLPYY